MSKVGVTCHRMIGEQQTCSRDLADHDHRGIAHSGRDRVVDGARESRASGALLGSVPAFDDRDGAVA